MSEPNNCDPYAEPDAPTLPPSTMELRRGRATLVVIGPQNDFLLEGGVTWGAVGDSVAEHGVVDNLKRLFKTARETDLPVFASPHYYYYSHDHCWPVEGILEKVMHSINMFDRKDDPLSLDGFTDSGADWLERYRPYFENGKIVVVSPHKVYGPNSNDFALQLRKRGIEQIILAGMSANLCVESHLPEFLIDRQDDGVRPRVDIAVASVPNPSAN